MELRQLQYFVAVAEELSFSAAARRLHMAQPPLSVQIKQLEEELGARLFDRTSRRVRLTSTGEIFLERARRILHESTAAVREAQRASRGEIGHVRLSFSGGTMTYDPLLPEVLRAYRALHPEVGLTLHEQPADQQIPELLAGRTDAAFLGLARADTTATSKGELAAECLLLEEIFAVLPEGHPLAGRRRVNRRQLEAEPLVWSIRQGTFLREGGFELPEQGMEVNSVATVFNYVAAGFGISILPRQFTGFAVRGVRFVPFPDSRPYRYGVAWQRVRTGQEPLAGFLACALEVASKRRREEKKTRP